jgi:predicted permease
MNYVMLYLFIGMLFGFIMESLLMTTGQKFTMMERLFMIVFWPLGVFAFLKELFK